MIVSRHNILSVTAACGVKTTTVAQAARFGNPDSPVQGPDAAKARIAKDVAFYRDLIAKAKIPQIQ